MAKKTQDPSTHKIPTKLASPTPNAKMGKSFVKRTVATRTAPRGRELMPADYSFGPQMSGGSSVTSGDDGAGTRSRANLPPKTEAMASPAAELPDAVAALASDVLPVLSVNDTGKVSRVGWDHDRDARLGKMGSR